MISGEISKEGRDLINIARSAESSVSAETERGASAPSEVEADTDLEADLAILGRGPTADISEYRLEKPLIFCLSRILSVIEPPRSPQ